jgi:Holliday junction resolvasome RuvABC endonuclease subunit
MKVLALDLGTRCGWAVFKDGAPIASGTWILQNDRQRRFEGAGMKWLRLNTLLSAAHGFDGFDKIAIEEVRRHMGVDAAHAYGGALAVVSAFCESKGIPYEGLPVATIKKHATGKGNAKKDAMIEAARAKWPAIAIEDDNHADALWIGDLASR